MLPSVVITAGISLLLYVTGVFVVFTPLPFILLYLRKGPVPTGLSFLSALLVLGLLYRFSPSPQTFLPLSALSPRLAPFKIMGLSLLHFFYYGWLGLSVAVASRRADTLEKSLIVVLGSSLLVPGLLLIAFSKGVGLDLLGEFQGTLQSLLDRMIAFQEGARERGEEALFLRQYAPTLVRQVVRLLPALVLSMTLLVAGLNILLLRRWAAPLSPFSGWGEFPLWRLRERWIWFPIGAGVLFFGNLYWIGSPPFGTVLLNLLLVLGAVYFFQGLAIVSFFFQRRLSPLLRLLGYLLIFLFVQMFGVFLVALGLFDFWFDFRKLKRVGG